MNRKPERGVLGQARGRILTELCGRPQTAAELAARVKTSANAVRVHLDALRAADLVTFHVHRRGVGKPTHVYSLTDSGKYLLSNAYVPTMKAIVDTIRRHNADALRPLLRDAGTSLGRTASETGADAAVRFLAALGASPTIKRSETQLVILNRCCPLAAITQHTPDVCIFLEGMIEAISNHSVREQCERGEQPQCRFNMELATRVASVSRD